MKIKDDFTEALWGLALTVKLINIPSRLRRSPTIRLSDIQD
jgi:hypothetical protein